MEQSKIQDGLCAEEVEDSLVEPNRPQHHPGDRRTRRGPLFLKYLTFFALLCLMWWQVIPQNRKVQRAGQLPPKDTAGKLVDYDDIIPSQKLEWHPCFAHDPAFQCARLTVPMDYHRPLNESGDNPKVHIALLLVPGKHDGPKKFSTSPLLLNPGGPGGSGVGIALAFGDRIHKVVGEDQDFIGFDPRGIGATTPRADCFSYPVGWPSTNTEDFTTGGGEDYARGNFNRLVWETAGRDIGLVNSSTGSWQMLDARAKGRAKMCQDKDIIMGNDSIFRHVDTPNVARDMLSIVDAWDAWTASLSTGYGMHESSETPKEAFVDPADDDLSHVKDNPGTKGKLVYWGFSYGTLLGATFASMFPDRVGRVILDGVVDADHYVAPVWQDSIRDADAIFNSFPRYCHEAEEVCLLWREGDKLSDLEARFFGVLEDLKQNPIIVSDPNSKIPVIITYSDVKSVVFLILYSPILGFFNLSYILDLILKGNAQSLARGFSLPLLFANYPDPNCEKPQPAWHYPNEAQQAIMCSDKRYPLNETIPNLKTIFGNMAKTSSFADVWLSTMLGCEGWGIEAVDPPMRWDDHPTHKQKPVNTSYPILFISNTYDPVTPLHAGIRMAKKFVNAGLIEQKSMGHCSLAAVSLCTISKIKAYLTRGEVPPPPKESGKGRELEDGVWDRCEADEWPFHPYSGSLTATATGVDAAAEVDAMNALKEMQEIFAEMKHWGQPQAPKISVLKGYVHQ